MVKPCKTAIQNQEQATEKYDTKLGLKAPLWCIFLVNRPLEKGANNRIIGVFFLFKRNV